MSVFKNLPLDIVNIILSYDNVIRYRNGKYINQIEESDPRKQMITGVPKIYICDAFYWDVTAGVVLHINQTKYYSISYCESEHTVGLFQHSGIDYQNPQPGDEDETTLLIDVFHLK